MASSEINRKHQLEAKWFFPEDEQEMGNHLQASHVDLKELQDTVVLRQAVLRKHAKEMMPDEAVEIELTKLKGRLQNKQQTEASNPKNRQKLGKIVGKKGHAPMRWLLIGAAACLAIVIGVAVWMQEDRISKSPDIAYDIPRQNLKQPTLVTSKGKTIPLTGQSQNISTAAGNRSARARLLDALGLEADEVSTEKCSIAVPPGKSYDIVLADGTKVWLYADSKLTYPLNFHGKERAVYLQGQAEFEVTHDSEHPFLIITDKLDARVLGTELNVSCYPNEEAHVALLNGSVVVSGKHGDNSVKLVPGQGVTLHEDGVFGVLDENMEQYELWKSGYLYFDDQPLENIAKSLGRWYRVKFYFDNPALSQKRLRFFCMRSDNLERALELLNHFGSFKAVHTADGVHIK
jgi:transmembrane sensor